MARLKTRDRIIEASLALFNSEGEPNVTTVDISNDLDISPGNLYYHFRGKEELVTELFARFHEQFIVILREPIHNRLRIEDYGFYLVVVFEHIHSYRFLYSNISLIMQRYEQIQRPFRRLIQLKFDAARVVCMQLREAGVIDTDEARIELLARNIALLLTYWFNFDKLLGARKTGDQHLIHDGVLQVLSLIAPYMGAAQTPFMDAALAVHAGAQSKT